MPVSQLKRDSLLQELDSLMLKGAIEEIPHTHPSEGIYSHLFLAPKKMGKWRPILNLKGLNSKLIKRKFRMETLKSVIANVKRSDWLIAIDLKDAYFHVPIRESHRKFLRFACQNRRFQYKVMPFGLSPAPRVFTKILAPIAEFLHVREIRIFPYIDDILIMAENRQLAENQKNMAIQLLVSLGWIINQDKSQLTPSQSMVFIGAHLKTELGVAVLPKERVQALISLVSKIRNQAWVTARRFLEMLGLMASTTFVVENALLFMRPLQLYLLAHWRPSTHLYEASIPIKKPLREHLKWWCQYTNLTKGIPFQQLLPQVTLTTDASLIGWGAVLNDQKVSGIWKTEQKALHINALEMLAVLNAIKHWITILTNKVIRVETDSTTVVSYIKRQGGTHSPALCFQSWELLNYCINHNITLRPVHVPGKQNFEADALSRIKADSTEWEISSKVIQRVFLVWQRPVIDLFATNKNRKLDLFCSRVPLEGTYQVDSLQMSWSNLSGYAFPPLNLVPLVLQKVQSDKTPLLILIAPVWKRRSWYPLLLHLLTDFPILLPPTQITILSKVKISNIQLAAWKLSGKDGEIKEFRKKLQTQLLQAGDSQQDQSMTVSGDNSTAGVLNGRSILFQQLFL